MCHIYDRNVLTAWHTLLNTIKCSIHIVSVPFTSVTEFYNENLHGNEGGGILNVNILISLNLY